MATQESPPAEAAREARSASGGGREARAEAAPEARGASGGDRKSDGFAAELGPDPLLGQEIGSRFRLQRKLAAGGQGRVYLALDRELKQPCAVKVAGSRAKVERIEREAAAVAWLKHVAGVPHILGHGVLPDGHTHYLAFDLVDGETLWARLRRASPLDWREAVRIAIGVAAVMTRVHERGVLHRDLAPSNVILTPDQRVFVIDYGVAQVAGLDPITDEEAVFGTRPFIAPEFAQRGAAALDRRADVYSLGVMLLQALAGEMGLPVPQDSTSHARPAAVAASLRRHVRALLAAAPPALVEVVARAIEEDRDRRFRSMEELGEALEACLRGGEAQATRRSWRGAGVLLARVAAAVAVVALASSLGDRWRRAPAEEPAPRIAAEPSPPAERRPEQARAAGEKLERERLDPQAVTARLIPVPE